MLGAELTWPTRWLGFQTCRLDTRLWFTKTLCFYLCRSIWATVNLDIGGVNRYRYRYSFHVPDLNDKLRYEQRTWVLSRQFIYARHGKIFSYHLRSLQYINKIQNCLLAGMKIRVPTVGGNDADMVNDAAKWLSSIKGREKESANNGLPW